MKFNDIQLELTTDKNRSSYQNIEFFITKLIQNYLSKNNIKYHILDGRLIPFDYFIESSLDDIEGPIFLEIKTVTSSSAILNVINNFRKHQLRTEPKPKSLIIITTLDEADIKKISKEIYDLESIKIYGVKYLDLLINFDQTFAKNLTENLYDIKFNSIITKKDDTSWQEKRDDLIKKLKLKFNEGKFSLLLGAGVSCDANLPSWEELISSLLVKSVSENLNSGSIYNDETISRVSLSFKDNQFNSALLSARYLKKFFTKKNSKNKKFENIIHEILYTSKNIDKNSKLVESIACLCIPTRLRAHVDSIITYNFDDLLEQNLDKKNLKYSVISNEIETYQINELPVYHVHGFIPQDQTKYNNTNNEIVFSEDGYHKIYSEPYHWSNLVQLTHLREKNCLMIGLSMDDPNLRRLLDIVANSTIETKHYALLQRVKLNKILPKSPQQSDIELATNFLQSHHLLQEDIFNDLGVNIIWYEEFSDVPKILSMLLN